MPSDFTDSISFDWFILALRIGFIGLIYYFLYRVSRESVRELMTLGIAAPSTASPTLPNAASRLEVVNPAESTFAAGDLLTLDHYTTVGRQRDNSLVINDSFVSGTHAEIVFDGDGWWLIDLGSTNGTFLNNAPVHARTRILDGDIVQFGRVTVRASV